MRNFLAEIIKSKKNEILEKKKRKKIEELISETRDIIPDRDFKKAISKKGRINLIGEIKKMSPSCGIIKEEIDIDKIAKGYKKGGVSAISVLTDNKFFGGHLSYINEVKEVVNLPVLRKDFVIDEYQIYESLFYGADAVLLISAILPFKKLTFFIDLAKKLGLDALVEVHSQKDLKTVLKTDADIIGINNRDLKTFKVDLNTTLKLVSKIPKDKIIISESGIETRKDIIKLKKAGVDAVLIGQTLMQSNNVVEKIREINA